MFQYCPDSTFRSIVFVLVLREVVTEVPIETMKSSDFLSNIYTYMSKKLTWGPSGISR